MMELKVIDEGADQTLERQNPPNQGDRIRLDSQIMHTNRCRKESIHDKVSSGALEKHDIEAMRKGTEIDEGSSKQMRPLDLA
jgi:hypothetical protein